MRAFPRASVVPAAAVAVLLSAAAAYAAPRGDHGSVTLQDAATDAAPPADRPEVCTFSLYAAGFAEGDRVEWRIVEVRPGGAAGTVAETGKLSLDAEGRGRTAELSLADGRYRMVWNLGEDEGDPGGPGAGTEFRVACDAAGQPEAGTEDGEPSGRPSDADGGAPSRDASRNPSAAESADTAGSSGPSGSPSAPASPPRSGEASHGAGRDLAETGAGVPAGALATAAASLLGAGTYLVLRRRESRSNGRR
ncbi:hypothetical protein [Streptomyces sp. JJ36]|uniref:hypothetical protein n=1 Tax=Streptomyces sp. JJ36 TaxID=2736645 RepID=UPI001F33508C|nr:hypothetical protein [Streptomyces sp. JJ36]MCF6522233.1 hypothetical protein [Streptomyces sp. JJ36]